MDWFLYNRDLRYERVKPPHSNLLEPDWSLCLRKPIRLKRSIFILSLNIVLSTLRTDHGVHQVIDAWLSDSFQSMFFAKMTFSVISDQKSFADINKKY